MDLTETKVNSSTPTFRSLKLRKESAFKSRWFFTCFYCFLKRHLWWGMPLLGIGYKTNTSCCVSKINTAKINSNLLSLVNRSNFSVQVFLNVFGLCVRAGFWEQSLNLLPKFIRSTELHVCTSARLTQNPCMRSFYSRSLNSFPFHSYSSGFAKASE